MTSVKEKILSIAILGILISIILILFIFIPSFFLSLKLKVEPLLLPLTLLKQSMGFILILAIPLLAKNNYPVKIITGLLAALYYFFIYFTIAYWHFIGDDFNPYFFIDSYNAIVETALNLFGLQILVIFLITLLFFYLFYFYLFLTLFKVCQQLYEKLETKKIFNFKYLIFLYLLIPIIPPNQSYLTHQYNIVKEFQEAREYFEPYLPDYSHFQTESQENIFILQIESTNALALQGNIEMGGKKYSDIYVPNLYTIAQDGILFPYFWSQSTQTDRAQENILCGIINNLGVSYSYTPKTMPQNTCLPNILKKSGYKTIAFRSDNLEFHNMGTFMKNLGFDEIHHDDIMQPTDTKYSWGYDDCIFYQRAFEYLKNNYNNASKLLVYFEVSSHHIPWDSKPKYALTHKFNPPNNFIEAYLNSALEQDYCVGQFYQEFKNYNNLNTHLFILGDNSWPVGVNNNNIFYNQNAYNDNFLTLMTYIPSVNRKNEFNLGKKIDKNNIYAQSDLIPTIFELLNKQSQQNSLVFELSKNKINSNYENCHILTQPYSGGNIAIAKNSDKYIYSILDKKVEYYNLVTDFLEKTPKLIAENLSYQEFKDQYFCPRYK